MRKYCLFEGGDVVGPFSAQELLARAGFGAHSLVCPDEYSDEESYWKEAGAYEEFGFSSSVKEAEEENEDAVTTAQSEQFLRAMDNVMSELSSLEVVEKLPIPTDAASFHLPQETTDSQTREPQKTENLPHVEEASSVPTSSTGRKISALLLQASEEMKKQDEPAEPKKAEDSLKSSSQMPLLQPAEEPAPEDIQPKEETNWEMEPVARTISKVNPLEEYFNTMRSGDLGNILGIPDPKENSDMSLSRAIQNQFEKSEPGISPSSEVEDPFDEFAPKSAPEELDENLFSDKTLIESDQETQERLMRSLPDLQQAAPLKVVGQGPSKLEEPLPPHQLEIAPEQDPEKTEPPTEQELIVPEQEDDPNDHTVKTILEGTLRVDTQRSEIPEPIKEVPAEATKQPATAEQAEDSLQHRVVKQKPQSKWKMVVLLGGLFVLSGIVLNLLIPEEETVQQPGIEKVEVKPEKQSPVSAKELIAAMQNQQTKNPVELAKEIVQQYFLTQENVTISEYLQQRYQNELQSGYAASWSAEPLHKDVYVVKYRLAKTRKEPIVYVFQVNVAKKKLTGALNNITLDLVGKIR
ncbi:MAG: hypothetical protein IKL48_02725 [Elusimicrobiaceae bacterium]|nr:hypothetical protein [Elusimicrobiaceae bacterium]